MKKIIFVLALSLLLVHPVSAFANTDEISVENTNVITTEETTGIVLEADKPIPG